MVKRRYVNSTFSTKTMETIQQAEDIINEYQQQGFSLTLRQLYYQFVARALLPNVIQSYRRLGSIISDARLAGLVDWEAIEDRTRNLRSLSHWTDPTDILQSAVASYRVDKWFGQPNYVEVWIEKDALVGVIEGACEDFDVPYFSCRGYVSQSEMWVAAQRFDAVETRKADVNCDRVLLHLGDYDPSGLDMTRDIQDRLELFGASVDVRRIALTRE